MTEYAAREVSRRTFLKTALATGAAATMAESVTGAQADDEGYIDAHVHVWTPDVKSYPLAKGFEPADMKPPSFTPEELFAHARPTGVRRITLIQMSFYRYDNSYMLDAMNRHKGVFSGVAVIDRNRDPVQTMLEMKAKGVRGFRIRPGEAKPDEWLTDEPMQSMWRCGAENNLAMCALIDPDYLPTVDRACEAFPDTPVVVDHFGRVGIDGLIRAKDLRNLCRLARHKNTYVKVSAYYALGRKKPPYADLGEMIKRVMDAFGPERLMWASDCPFQVQGEHTYAASIDLIKSGLDFLSDHDKQWILRKTAEKVYFS